MTKTDEQRQEKRGAEEVAPIQRHGDGVAAGLAERRRRDLDDPEHQRDFGNFTRSSFDDIHQAASDAI